VVQLLSGDSILNVSSSDSFFTEIDRGNSVTTYDGNNINATRFDLGISPNIENGKAIINFLYFNGRRFISNGNYSLLPQNISIGGLNTTNKRIGMYISYYSYSPINSITIPNISIETQDTTQFFNYFPKKI
jgi:hypothetical protein